LYCAAVSTVAFGVMSCQRIRMASSPPNTKKKSDVWRYNTPIFLWSVVVIHSIHAERVAPELDV